MIIREAVQEDLPNMVNLLKISMGETLLPKSEAYFLWKHEQNPFGKSKILLAEESGQIIGLRAFMHWQWIQNNQTIIAVRAVDTATHPDFQGKGIFRTLTLAAVDSCKQDGVDMVFNSPNPKSKAGYLKMGWVTAGTMPVNFGIGSIIPSTYNETNAAAVYEKYSVKEALLNLSQSWKLNPTNLQAYTPLNYDYLNWRYNNCPVVKYGGAIFSGKYGFIFRLKKFKFFNELRLCEAWLESPEYLKEATKAFKKIIQSTRPLVITHAVTPLFPATTSLVGIKLPINKGPLTTVRPLKMDNLETFINFKNWQPSIGSLELF